LQASTEIIGADHALLSLEKPRKLEKVAQQALEIARMKSEAP